MLNSQCFIKFDLIIDYFHVNPPQIYKGFLEIMSCDKMSEYFDKITLHHQ